MKKITALIITVFMLLSLIPLGVSAESATDTEMPETEVYEDGPGGTDPCPTEDYTDVPPLGHWAHDGIDFAVSTGLMGSTYGDKLVFEPQLSLTRAMTVMILFRLCGAEEPEFEAIFPDVTETKWFSKCVTWAAKAELGGGIIKGYDDGTFKPDRNVTREELAAIFQRFSGGEGDETDSSLLDTFEDGNLCTWSADAASWAVMMGIISGKDNNGKLYFDPKGNASRQEMAVILMRYLEDGPVMKGSLTYIARLNGMKTAELNVILDENGFVTFLGNRFSTHRITDFDDEDWDGIFEDVLPYIEDGKNEEYTLVNEYESPVSGNRFYSFSPCETTEIEGGEITVPSAVRFTVGFDRDGNGVSLSSCVSSGLEANTGDPITKEEIRKLIEDDIIRHYPGYELLEDSFELIEWKSGIFSNWYGASVLPCWGVYIKTSEDIKEPYTYLVFPAVKSPLRELNGLSSYWPIASVPCEKPDYTDEDADYEERRYSSYAFFRGFEDAGEYTYTLDMTNTASVSKFSVTPYIGPDFIEVTVPLMRRKSDGMYFLGNVRRMIAVTNFAEFNSTVNPTNMPCSATPEDLSSWAFEKPDKYPGSPYFFDPNYVFASYSAMIETYDIYNSLYGLRGPNLCGLPICLCVYYYLGYYPEMDIDFTDNAACGGEVGDWEMFITSPVCPACFETEVMGHEFGHGIQMEISPYSGLNETGIISEGVADIFGGFSSMVYYGRPGPDMPLGGKFASPIRTVSDPGASNQPYLKNGACYVPGVSEEYANMGLADFGGIHTNNSVLSWLSWQMVFSEDENCLSAKENLDLWLEAIQYFVTNAGLDEMAGYLILASETAGLSEEKREFVIKKLSDYGFLGESEEYERMLSGEECDTITVAFDTENCTETGYEADVSVTFTDGTSSACGMTEDGRLSFRIPEKDIDRIYLRIMQHTSAGSGLVSWLCIEDGGNNKNYVIHLSDPYVDSGEAIVFADGEKPYAIYSIRGIEKIFIEDEREVTLITRGVYVIAAVSEGFAPGEITARIVSVG